MASIFTFDPEPPRVLSPWAKLDGVSAAALKETEETSSSVVPGSRGSAGLMPNPAGITKLVAEPQLGPTEYKLHLLLRPRRRYTVLTTGTYVAGSQHFKPGSSPTTSGRDPSTSHVESPRLSPLPPNQSQHYRLQQLTTQLLWRLQQSLPHHSSSATASSTPSADPADPRLQRSGLLPGLEESHGALYEIGVSDEGTCVGLARDELEESLATLGVMARSLGCAVQVLRRVVVGTCEWMEETEIDVQEEKRLRRDNLWVAEALVKPICQGSDHSEPARPVLSSSPSQPTEREQDAAADGFQGSDGALDGPLQLRISLTGGTTSGKSSLLGTLLSGTLDNSRGRSRLSLLRHRHELVSGLTSSVAQELIGYKPLLLDQNAVAEVINYSSGNISSWTDIHATAHTGRLVFFSDSAGHPRYRRTAIRGLVGWAPHWAALCIAADGENPTSARPGQAHPDAHLRLCLDLGLPLIVIITKLDAASKASLRDTLGKCLSILRSAGRIPVLIPVGWAGEEASGLANLRIISARDEADVGEALGLIGERGPHKVVPVVLTSAVQGLGIRSLHALLWRLPVPLPSALPRSVEPILSASPSRSPTVFHIEETFALPGQFASTLKDSHVPDFHRTGSVVSGHLQNGSIRVGDEMLLGPFPREDVNDWQEPPDGIERSIRSISRDSDPEASAVGYSHEWRRVRVISIRNLRLPVSALLAGQVGSIGLVPSPTKTELAPLHGIGSKVTSSAPPTSAFPLRVRKGMVLGHFGFGVARSFAGFVGIFRHLHSNSLTEGASVVVYTASVRGAARISGVRSVPYQQAAVTQDATEDNLLDAGTMSSTRRPLETARSEQATEITCHFLGSREYVTLAGQVLIMSSAIESLSTSPEGRLDGASFLEGFVGRIVRLIV